MKVIEEFIPQRQVILPRDNMAPEHHWNPQLCNGAGA